MNSCSYNNRRKPPICRSTFLRAEEIAQERAQSGWNQYEGEEESGDMMQWNNRPMPPQRWETQPTQPMPPQRWNNRPIFRGPDYETVMEEQRNVERDLRMLQSMYPEAAKILLPYIEEMCDKMEYEGSMMFDRFPDQTTLYRMQDEILDRVRDQFPNESMQEEPDEVLSMQYQGRRRNPPGKNWLEDMVRVMLLQEMHHRRCRHRNCRWR